MKPIKFKESNMVLTSKAKGMGSLPVFKSDLQTLSCWKMSLVERIKALFFGRVWICLLVGNYRHPPIYANVEKSAFENKETQNEG